jgi:hypothetical protein
MKSNRYIVGIVTAGRKDPTSVGYEAVDTPCGKILVEEGIIAKTKDKDIFNRISKIFAECTLRNHNFRTGSRPKPREFRPIGNRTELTVPTLPHRERSGRKNPRHGRSRENGRTHPRHSRSHFHPRDGRYRNGRIAAHLNPAHEYPNTPPVGAKGLLNAIASLPNFHEPITTAPARGHLVDRHSRSEPIHDCRLRGVRIARGRMNSPHSDRKEDRRIRMTRRHRRNAFGIRRKRPGLDLLLSDVRYENP